MDATPASARHQPTNRLTLVLSLLSVATGLVASVAVSLAVVLSHLAFAGYEPSTCDPHYRVLPQS
jgi:hypothetical protein